LNYEQAFDTGKHIQNPRKTQCPTIKQSRYDKQYYENNRENIDRNNALGIPERMRVV
jgi:hypothetical protein